jgi:hypothetical protein
LLRSLQIVDAAQDQREDHDGSAFDPVAEPERAVLVDQEPTIETTAAGLLPELVPIVRCRPVPRNGVDPNVPEELVCDQPRSSRNPWPCGAGRDRVSILERLPT